MNKKKQRALEASGWAVGSVAEVLKLSPQENLAVELRVSLAKTIREHRAAKELTQSQLAKLMSSTQAKVSDAEHGVGTIDIMIRALGALGVDARTLAASITV